MNGFAYIFFWKRVADWIGLWENSQDTRHSQEGGVWSELIGMMPDYRINLVDIRKLEETSMFKTDVRQVFDFIRCSEDDGALRELVENDEYYKNMEEDAFDVAVHYTNAVRNL